ncbi:uncharacterized protein LOC110840519 isoform X1 [Zootermopsis nevadensis]|uniref:uncharacterized protein LOC110840519 isoform X1 n=1 Tax=Zootermopsis nevadensis TaxID=136037 RepID=UPI000B8ED949|nr:uncharacterized protein LOC110840519 isoform X1 [Zootermopsis nevadensis]XP_021941302.1 uncharacterized protein LOC110840519 isoform X1 [Zootermopsis nevadensis]
MMPLKTSCFFGQISVRSGALILAVLETVIAAVGILLSIIAGSGGLRLSYRYDSIIINFILIGIIGVVINLLLIAGIEKKKPALILPAVIHYLVGTAVLFVIICNLFYIATAIFISTIILVVGPLIIGIFFYFWLIVYSYYRQLKSEVSGNISRLDNPLENEPMFGVKTST